jgi:hypothetical protein
MRIGKAPPQVRHVTVVSARRPHQIRRVRILWLLVEPGRESLAVEQPLTGTVLDRHGEGNLDGRCEEESTWEMHLGLSAPEAEH